MAIKLSKVLLAIPTRESINALTVSCLLNLTQEKRYLVDLYIAINSRCVEDARNTIVAHFLKGDCDYLLSIDYDNPPIWR